MKFSHLAACVLLLVASTGVVVAADQGPAEIVAAQQAIRARAEARTGEFAKLTPEKVKRITEAQDRVFSLLQGVTSLDQLQPAQRAELDASLKVVEAGLRKEQKVCYNEASLGSNIPRRRCESADSREARSRDAREVMDRLQGSSRSEGVSLGGN